MSLRHGLALAALLFACTSLRAETVRFAAFGDTPYRHWERENLPEMMAEMDAAKLAFVVNIGDIKSGDTPCSDAVYNDILGLFQNAAHPLIYIPGDNEWTDCKRGGEGYRAQERLNRLRQLFYADDYSLGRRKLKLTRQSKNPQYAMYRENARWQSGPLLFVTINVPGSANGIADPRRPSAEFVARNAAVLEWLSASFKIARERAFPGIVVFMHADPGLEKAMHGTAHVSYVELLQKLVAETKGFAGQVLLVHGDTHYHRIDKPLGDPDTGAILKNFTRLEVYGSPFMGWVEVVADTERPGLFRYKSHPFSITTQEN